MPDSNSPPFIVNVETPLFRLICCELTIPPRRLEMSNLPVPATPDMTSILDNPVTGFGATSETINAELSNSFIPTDDPSKISMK